MSAEDVVGDEDTGPGEVLDTVGRLVEQSMVVVEPGPTSRYPLPGPAQCTGAADSLSIPPRWSTLAPSVEGTTELPIFPEHEPSPRDSTGKPLLHIRKAHTATNQIIQPSSRTRNDRVGSLRLLEGRMRHSVTDVAAEGGPVAEAKPKEPSDAIGRLVRC
jgi:hypothetical protein